jgi:4-hydroxybenzoate polyprenyltransferase
MSGGTLAQDARPSRPSRLWSYAQLLRIPNVFTAIADVLMAALATGSLPGQIADFLLLAVASSCLYCGGLVWNDYFDYAQDLKERPSRPLPSNRIGRSTAARLGVLLLLAGVVIASFAGWREGSIHAGPFLVALLLVGAILLYDVWLKRTVFGPLSMGSCRFLNVVLGLTIGIDGIPQWGYVLALVIGLYIVGVTWFARREASTSKELDLKAAALVMLAALVLALWLPVVGQQLARGDGPKGVGEYVLGEIGHLLFPYLLVAFGFWIGIPVTAAIRNPQPLRVQTAVKRAILGLIVLDAILATSQAGTPGLLVLLLLPPAVALGKRFYST